MPTIEISGGEHQTPFNLNIVKIEQKLFALAISESGSGHCTGYNLKLQGANIGVFTPIWCLIILSRLTSPVTAATTSVPRSSTLVQLIRFTLSKL